MQIDYTPHAAQMEIHRARNARFRTICTGRRFGKTLCMAAELLDREMSHYEKQIPRGRIATLEEAANAVLFLAGDTSSYMTGSVLDFSGGQLGR